MGVNKLISRRFKEGEWDISITAWRKGDYYPVSVTMNREEGKKTYSSGWMKNERLIDGLLIGYNQINSWLEKETRK